MLLAKPRQCVVLRMLNPRHLRRRSATLTALLLKADPKARSTFAKVFEQGRRTYESGKKTYSEFEFTMRKRLGAAWDKLKSFVRRVWDRLKAINAKLGQREATEKRQGFGKDKEKSALNAFQRKQVATPEFVKWFGKSKVVDANGRWWCIMNETFSI